MIRAKKMQVKQFQAQLDGFTKDLLPQDVLKFTKVLAMHILRGVMQKTPVGNPLRWKNPKAAPKGYVGGHARMNWQVSLEQPAGGQLPGADPGGFMAEMAGLLKLSSAQPYQKVWIVNNVPYILVLENGRAPINGVMRGSTQAPHGMLGVTMQELRRDFGGR